MQEYKKMMPLLETLLVFLVLMIAYFNGLDKVKFHPDESHWIGLSGPFEKFTSGQFEPEYWQSLPMAYVNSTMTYYVIGIARQFGGYSPNELNPIYDFSASYEQNLAEGRIPDPGLLWWGRAGVTFCAILALLITFILFKQAVGRPLAYTWLFFVLVNPYLREMLRRAMNEGVLLFFIMLSIWFGYKALTHLVPDRFPAKNYRALAWLTLSGITAGLAAQTKINGGMVVLGVWTVFAAALLLNQVSRKAKFFQVGLVASLLIVTSLTTYVGSNPSLWGNPASTLRKVFTKRINLMETQSDKTGNQHMFTIEGRFTALSNRIFVDHAIIPSPLPNGFLFLAGAILGIKKIGMWMKSRDQNHALLILLVAGTITSLPAFVSPLDWPRYFLLPSFFFGLVSILGLGMIVGWLKREADQVSISK